MHVCICMCMYVCVYIYIYIHTYVYNIICSLSKVGTNTHRSTIVSNSILNTPIDRISSCLVIYFQGHVRVPPDDRHDDDHQLHVGHGHQSRDSIDSYINIDDIQW